MTALTVTMIVRDAHYNLEPFDEARSSYEAAMQRQSDGPAVLAKLCLATIRSGDAKGAFRGCAMRW